MSIKTSRKRRRAAMRLYGVICALMLFFAGVGVYAVFFRDGVKTNEPADVNKNTATVTSAPEPESLPESKPEPSSEAPAESSPTDESRPVESESSVNESEDDNDEPPRTDKDKHTLKVIEGRTYVDDILIVNKTYSLPSTYAPGLLPEAEAAFYDMAGAAWGDGISLFICSGFRSYQEQKTLWDGYAMERGVEAADRVSSRAGHSEHQSGLCMDINTTDFEFEGTPEAIWLQNHCAEYGFIIRFPRGKEEITGYAYEPWHIRFVGIEAAEEIMDGDLCLEEYLGVTSDYRYSKDQNDG